MSDCWSIFTETVAVQLSTHSARLRMFLIKFLAVCLAALRRSINDLRL